MSVLTARGAIHQVPDVRRVNLQTALQLVLDADGTITRAEIARRTGLTPATASSLLAELIDEELVEPGETLSKGPGKPAVTLHVDRSHVGVLALTLRPDTITAAVVDLRGDAVVELTRPTAASGIAMRDVIELARDARDRSGLRILSGAVDAPGVIDRGDIVSSVHLGVHDLAVAGPLGEALGVPIAVVNDADAGALAEIAHRDRQEEGFVYLHLGDGIGSSVVVDGDLWRRGDHSGEIGHLRVDLSPDARQCECSRTGCLEATSAFPVLIGDDSGSLDAHQLAARTAEPAVQQRIRAGAGYLAGIAQVICATLGLPTVVIGGDAPRLGEEFLRQVQAALDAGQPTGVRPVTVEFAASRTPSIGAAQEALTLGLGVRWTTRALV